MSILKYKLRKFDDEKLMLYLQQGDSSAFNELYNRYSKRLLHYFFRMLGANEDKAQDFLQDTFLKIVEKPSLFQQDKKFATWIFTIAHNLCKNEYRRMQVRNGLNNVDDIDTIPVSTKHDYHPLEQNVDGKIFTRALSVELGKLSADQRSVFVLRYQQHLTIKEISKILASSEGTIKSRLFYTTRKLANSLKNFDPNIVEV